MSDIDHRRNLVLVHGWGLGNAAWDDVLPALTQRFRVHLFTLPGYRTPESRMDKQSSDQCLEEAHEQTIFNAITCRTPFDALSSPSFAQTAQALADTLPENCILCGWSLGSLLALQAASVVPQCIKKLILIGGTPSFTQRANWPHAQPPALLDTFCDAIAKDAAGTLKRFIALFNQGDAQARQIGRAMIKQLLATPLPDTATLLAGLGWLRDVDLRQQIASIAVPTVLIQGESDPLMPLAAAQWLKEALPNAQLEVFSGAAHAPFLNDPDRFATLIGDDIHASAFR